MSDLINIKQALLDEARIPLSLWPYLSIGKPLAVKVRPLSWSQDLLPDLLGHSWQWEMYIPPHARGVIDFLREVGLPAQGSKDAFFLHPNQRACAIQLFHQRRQVASTALSLPEIQSVQGSITEPLCVEFERVEVEGVPQAWNWRESASSLPYCAGLSVGMLQELDPSTLFVERLSYEEARDLIVGGSSIIGPPVIAQAIGQRLGCQVNHDPSVPKWHFGPCKPLIVFQFCWSQSDDWFDNPRLSHDQLAGLDLAAFACWIES